MGTDIDAGYGVYSGNDDMVSNKVLKMIAEILEAINPLAYRDAKIGPETSVSESDWPKLKQQLARNCLLSVRDPLSFPVKIEDIQRLITITIQN